MGAPIHLHPTTDLAPRVLLPGDPGRAPDGEPLTIQSTGMGAPSAAIVVSELADLGAERLVRVGTCGAL
ncbi:MAG: purine-nucleoside phosphorylase, partial [Solirubrobacteraceae bacterium]|nr:purine-nucleoside phosphorylase [Solirubrobacteraceae bacterium]